MAKGCSLIVLRFSVIVYLALSTTRVKATYPWSSATSKFMTICEDKECYARTKVIRESMDKNADPCDDFYQYVCGNWISKNPKPHSKYEWTVETKLDMKTVDEMSAILKYGIGIHEPNDSREAKQLYQICNNLPSLSIMDATHLKPIVKQAGPWPMFSPEVKSQVSWYDIHDHYLQITGDAGLFDINVQRDRKTGEILLHLGQVAPPLGLIKRLNVWSNDNNIKHQYFLLILAQMVGEKSKKANDKNLIQDIIEVLAFRQKLEKNIHPDSLEYSPMTIENLQRWYDIKAMAQKGGIKFPWLKILRTLLKNTGLKISGDTKVVILNRDSLSYLPRLFSTTPKHVIANHLHLYFVEKHILINEDLDNALENLLISNGKIIGTAVSRSPRSTTCILMHPMKDTLGKLYREHHFNKQTEESVLYYSKRVRKMIERHITNSEWLNSDTKEMLISKLNDIDLNMGYRNRSEPEDSDPKELGMTPYRAISFYTPKENGIFISAGYFRSPVYGYDLPSAVNYATIATFIAYEMYHALNGQYMEPTTSKGTCEYCWPEDMLKILQKKSKCFEDIYTDLLDKQLEKIKPHPKTNGAQTLFENIADIMGIRTGMDSFKKLLWTSQGKCRLLPHIKDLTCEKLFFISYAATFCSASPNWILLQHAQMGTHSTSRLRVNVPLANMEEFRKAFQCSSNSRMVLKNNCYLW